MCLEVIVFHKYILEGDRLQEATMDNKDDGNKKFEEIKTAEELIKYLKKPFSRTGNRKKADIFLYHYTNIEGLVGIVESNTWHLCQAQCMNDKLEYQNGDTNVWKRIYFSSFMLEEKENIGLWSMYGQPWERGIKIAVPLIVVENWIQKMNILYEVDCRTKQKGRRIFDKADLFACSVAYSNTDSDNIDGFDVLKCGTVSNDNLRKSRITSKLTGYIKNDAWFYEKEVRIRAEFLAPIEPYRIAVELNDEMISSMIITPSPLFEGNIEGTIRKEVQRSFKVEPSIYHNRLFLSPDCDNCDCTYLAK